MNCSIPTYKEYLLKRSYFNDPFKSYKFIEHCDVVAQILGVSYEGDCKEVLYNLYCNDHNIIKQALDSISF